jgi:hypothetical protein
MSIKSPHEAQIHSMNSTQYDSESMPKHHNLTHNVCKHSNLRKEQYIQNSRSRTLKPFHSICIMGYLSAILSHTSGLPRSFWKLDSLIQLLHKLDCKPQPTHFFLISLTNNWMQIIFLLMKNSESFRTSTQTWIQMWGAGAKLAYKFEQIWNLNY